MRGELSPLDPTPSRSAWGEMVPVTAPKPVWVAGFATRFDFVLPEARLTTSLLLHEMVLHNRGSGSV